MSLFFYLSFKYLLPSIFFTARSWTSTIDSVLIDKKPDSFSDKKEKEPGYHPIKYRSKDMIPELIT